MRLLAGDDGNNLRIRVYFVSAHGTKSSQPCLPCTIVLWMSTILSAVIQTTAAQVIMPGRNPKIYLPPKCDGFALNGLPEGIIYSHEGNNRYHPNTDCVVYFNIGPNQVVHFDFEEFSLQNRIRGQCVDYVQFFAADGADGRPLTERLCGQSLPKSLMTSNLSRIAMRFRTNSRHETRGFQVRFRRSAPAGCDRATESGRSHLEVATDRRHLFHLMGLPLVFLIFPTSLIFIILYRHFS